MSEELKNCPFCDSDDIKLCSDESIRCRWCGAESGDNWNTRPLEDALRKQITALKTALEFYAGAGNYKHTPGGFGFQGMKSPAVINDNGEIARAALDWWNSGEIRELEDGEK